MTARTTAVAPQTQQTNQTPIVQKKLGLYQIAATRLANSAPALAYTAVVLVAMANLPGAAANCEAAEKICVATCMALGGPMPTETGACLAGCKLAYWACKAGAAYMGWPG